MREAPLAEAKTALGKQKIRSVNGSICTITEVL